MQLPIRGVLTAGLAVAGMLAGPSPRLWSQQPAAQGQTAKPVGTIESINGNTIVLKLDAGSLVTVIVQGTPRILRVAPGKTDLKSATPIQLQDLQVGDRVLVSGKLGDDGKSVVAGAIVAMKASDVQSKQQKERAEWQRGAGGLVDGVDAAGRAVTISVAGPGGVRKVAVQTTKDTIFRRYAPDSVNFDDAKPSSLDQIKAGDQLRARGTRTADGNDIAAVEVITGSFRNISGTIISVDAAAHSIRVNDLATKKPIVVKVTPDSQVRMLPPEVAQRIAMQLRAARGGGAAADSGRQAKAAPAEGGGNQRDPVGGGSGGRVPDLQQMLGRLTLSTLSDLKIGDAVMVVSTEGTANGEVTAITLLGGVEPILTAPGGAQGMTLSPWSVGGGGGEGDAGQ